ncbi:MAG: hypothetical protein ACRYGR_01855 [Janthinobacterium lividum]
MLSSDHNYLSRQGIKACFNKSWNILNLDLLKGWKQLSQVQRSMTQHLENVIFQPLHTLNILKFTKEVKVI